MANEVDEKLSAMMAGTGIIPHGVKMSEITQDELLEMIFGRHQNIISPFTYKTKTTLSGIEKYLFVNANSTGRFQLFLDIVDELYDYPKVFWHGLARAYTCSDNLYEYNESIKELFQEDLPYKEYLMNKTERKWLAELQSKPKLTIYRAMTIDEAQDGDYGVSWTTKKSVANFFAKKYIRNLATNGMEKVVVKLVIDTSAIHAVFMGRNEYEIIYIND